MSTLYRKKWRFFTSTVPSWRAEPYNRILIQFPCHFPESTARVIAISRRSVAISPVACLGRGGGSGSFR